MSVYIHMNARAICALPFSDLITLGLCPFHHAYQSMHIVVIAEAKVNKNI